MRILLVSMMVPEAPSGVRVHYQRLAAGLRQQGHTVTVLTPASARLWQRRAWGLLRRVLDAAGPLGQHLGHQLHSAACLLTALDRRAPYDVVNAQDATTGYLLRRALRNQVPVVVTGHFNGHPGREVVHSLGLRGRAARLTLAWHDFFLARTRYFLSVSEYVRAQVAPLLPACVQHAVVPHGLHLADFAAAPPAAELLARAAGRPVLLNIGHLEARKNQAFLLDVAAELRRLEVPFLLGLVGQGPDAPTLQARIEAEGLHDYVWLAGPRAEVASLLRASTLYVHAARNESFGLVLLEAMACGVPTLAAAVGAVPEVLAHDPDALLPPDASAAAVAQRLAALLADPAARARLAARQHAHAAHRFSQQAMLAGTLAAYERARGDEAAPIPTTAAPLGRPVLAAEL